MGSDFVDQNFWSRFCIRYTLNYMDDVVDDRASVKNLFQKSKKQREEKNVEIKISTEKKV